MGSIIPDTYHFTIIRGRDFDETFEFPALNLTGYTAKMQIRTAESQSAPLIAEVTLTVTPGTDSTIRCVLTDTVTAAITHDVGYYDLLISNPGGSDDTYVRGTITVLGSVTVKS